MIRIAGQVFHMVGLIAMYEIPTGGQSIDRAARLLVAVAESDEPISVRELVERTDLPKSTVSRLVAALERNALVQRESARGPLRPGPVLMRLARRSVPDRDLVELCDPVLARLAEPSGETINLAVPTPLGVEHLSQVDSHHFIGSTNWIGRRVPHTSTAVGKVFLAFGAVRLTREHAALRPELETVRARGYATAIGELEPGLAAIAAPVRDGSGDVLAALSISGPEGRLTRERITELAPGLLQEAATVSARLGYRTTTQGAA
jgi:IclR family acetate operon transcriptional repressor